MGVINRRQRPSGAALRFRYAMLAGNRQNIDLVRMRREAIAYSDKMMRSESRLSKTSAALRSELGPGNIGGRVRSILINPTVPLCMKSTYI
jgi:hypothetical protein